MTPEPNPSAPDSRISHDAANAYWNKQPASVTGMLGGIPQVSRADIQGSKNFFAKLQRKSALGKRRRGTQAANGHGTTDSAEDEEASKPVGSYEADTPGTDFPIRRAVDCGAGIGRVTLNFLSTIAHTVDVVEPVLKFTDEISEGRDFAELRKADRIGRIYNVGLESWTPETDTYNLIWHQWCLGQLTDAELVTYLRRAKAGLAEGGWVGVKENCSGGDIDDFDPDDSAVTRSLANWRALFKQAGYRIDMEEIQRGFPKGLFVVRMWALKPL